MRFYQSLRSFLIFNGIITLLFLFGRTGGGLFTVSLIWGAVLFARSVKLFGWPGTNGWLGRDWEDWMAHRERNRPTDDDEPAIRDRDLV